MKTEGGILVESDILDFLLKKKHKSNPAVGLAVKHTGRDATPGGIDHSGNIQIYTIYDDPVVDFYFLTNDGFYEPELGHGLNDRKLLDPSEIKFEHSSLLDTPHGSQKDKFCFSFFHYSGILGLIAEFRGRDLFISSFEIDSVNSEKCFSFMIKDDIKGVKYSGGIPCPPIWTGAPRRLKKWEKDFFNNWKDLDKKLEKLYASLCSGK